MTVRGGTIELDAVEGTFAPRGGQRYPALRGVSLAVAAGEHVAVLGKSGSGKSTLVNLSPRSTARARAACAWPAPRWGGWARAPWPAGAAGNVGVVFQFFQLLPTLTVAENVDAADGAGRRDSARRAAARARWSCWRRQASRSRPKAPLDALGRPAAARGDRARPGERSADPAGRRADREPRQRDRGGDRRAVRAAGRARQDAADRHARRAARARGGPGGRAARRSRRLRQRAGTRAPREHPLAQGARRRAPLPRADRPHRAGAGAGRRGCGRRARRPGDPRARDRRELRRRARARHRALVRPRRCAAPWPKWARRRVLRRSMRAAWRMRASP